MEAYEAHYLGVWVRLPLLQSAALAELVEGGGLENH